MNLGKKSAGHDPSVSEDDSCITTLNEGTLLSSVLSLSTENHNWARYLFLCNTDTNLTAALLEKQCTLEILVRKNVIHFIYLFILNVSKGIYLYIFLKIITVDWNIINIFF